MFHVTSKTNAIEYHLAYNVSRKFLTGSHKSYRQHSDDLLMPLHRRCFQSMFGLSAKSSSGSHRGKKILPMAECQLGFRSLNHPTGVTFSTSLEAQGMYDSESPGTL